MAHLAGRISAGWIVTLALVAGLLGACATETPVVTTTSAPATQTVVYQGGQYRLYGSGTATSPYYWVWVPTGVTAPAPPTTIATSTVAYGRSHRAGPAAASHGSGRGSAGRPVSALRQRHDRVSVLLGVDSQWKWSSDPAAATAGASLGLIAT